MNERKKGKEGKKEERKKMNERKKGEEGKKKERK